MWNQLRAVSISMWVKVGEPPEQELSLLSTHDWDESALHLLLTNDRHVLLTVNGNEPGEIVSRGALGKRIGDWMHLGVVLDHKNRRWKIYFDGRLDRLTRLEHVVPIDLNDIRIGAWNLEPRAFVGEMAEIRIYDRALTSDEIVAIARRAAPEQNLVAWWPLDESEEDLVRDKSGHERHGVICDATDIDINDEWAEEHEDDGEPAPPNPPEVKLVDPVRSLRQAIDCLAEQFPVYRTEASQLHSRLDRLARQSIDGPSPGGLPWHGTSAALGLRAFGHLGRCRRGLLRLVLGSASHRVQGPSFLPTCTDV